MLETNAIFGSPSVSSCADDIDVRGLISLAAHGLSAMLETERQLFCHRLLLTDRGLVREGVSHRYTAMALLGLKQMELASLPSPIETMKVYKACTRDTNWIQGIGDIGLLIWLTSAFDPDHLDAVLSQFDCAAAMGRCTDARSSRTMELAWLLSGLVHAAEISRKRFGTLIDLCAETYRRLIENQSDCGLFAHMSATRSLTGRLRAHIGSFADQVYPIYALSKFSTIFQITEPLSVAYRCAALLCESQGDLGQWWWLYNTRKGQISSHYPVYSVHQHGMAPMALLALEEASGRSFRNFLWRGLSWVFGNNELRCDMRDQATKTIWRCVTHERTRDKYFEVAISAVSSLNQIAQKRTLEILYEQRPYEYGWLLFALARNLFIPEVPPKN